MIPGRGGGDTATVETNETSCPSSQSGTSSRPPSPTKMTRLQEKNELASLNDRLASYIDRMRQLEGDNTRLTRVIQTQEETGARETVKIKGGLISRRMSLGWVIVSRIA